MRHDTDLVDRTLAESFQLIMDIGSDLKLAKEAFDTFGEDVPDVNRLPPALNALVSPIKARLDANFAKMHPDLLWFMETGSSDPNQSKDEFLASLRVVVLKILAQRN